MSQCSVYGNVQFLFRKREKERREGEEKEREREYKKLLMHSIIKIILSDLIYGSFFISYDYHAHAARLMIPKTSVCEKQLRYARR